MSAASARLTSVRGNLPGANCQLEVCFGALIALGTALMGGLKEETTEMRDLNRRSFVGAPLPAFPLAAVVQSVKTSTLAGKAALVPHGEDRQGEHHSIGISSTDFKVTTEDSGGALFLFEHTN